MKATQGSSNYKPVPLPKPSTVFARCYSVIDIGTVPQMFNGEKQNDARMIHVTWELPGLLGVFNEEKGKQPFVISKEFRASTKSNSNLAQLISTWRNKAFTAEEEAGFDPSVMIGKTCFISFVHATKVKFRGKDIAQVTNENTVMKLNGIMPVPEGVAVIPAINPYFNWDWDAVATKGFNKEEFEKIPRFLQAKMATSQEFSKYAGGYNVAGSSYDNDNSSDAENEKTPDTPAVEGTW